MNDATTRTTMTTPALGSPSHLEAPLAPARLGLARLQALLYRLITAPGGVAEGLARECHRPSGGRERLPLDQVIVGDDRLSAAARLTIYANGYFYRLLEVLKEEFPATLAVIGADHFHNLITAYLRAYPPTAPSLQFAGAHLPRFLGDAADNSPTSGDSSDARWSGAAWPYLADLAALERAVTEVFHAAAAPVLEAATLTALAPAEWPRLILRTVPAMRLLAVNWRVDELMRAAVRGVAWSAPAAAASGLLVWRRGHGVFHRPLAGAEQQALAMVAVGENFATICGMLAATREANPAIETADQADAANPVESMRRLLARWLDDGLLCANGRVSED